VDEVKEECEIGGDKRVTERDKDGGNKSEKNCKGKNWKSLEGGKLGLTLIRH